MAETVLTLHESPVSPVVLQETLRELVIDASAPLTLTLTAPAQTACSLVVRIRHAEALTIQVRAEAASQLTLLYWNESSAPITIRESNEIYRDARFKAAYVQLNPGTVDHQSKTLLKERGAEVLVQSAVIAQTQKQFVVDLIHQAGQTTGIMENYSIVLQGGRYRMEATGKIEKGARGAKSHQTSRALTFDAQQTATILPKLLIDENDVEASHATTIGQMDENQMYYLQSRGLSEDEAIRLVTIGYLLPIARISDDPKLQEALAQEIETKVNEVCLTSSK